MRIAAPSISICCCTVKRHPAATAWVGSSGDVYTQDADFYKLWPRLWQVGHQLAVTTPFNQTKPPWHVHWLALRIAVQQASIVVGVDL